MDLEVFVQAARLWQHDPGPQPALLIRKLRVIRKLRAENAETIIGGDAYRRHRDVDPDAEERTERNKPHNPQPRPDPGDGIR